MRTTNQEFAEEPFIGFRPPTSNYFRLPNEWIDVCAHIDNLAELKVVMYVLRHTWGFHEYRGEYKHLTIDDFVAGRKKRDGTRMDSGTGLSERAVRYGLERALEHGFLEVERDESDKARIRKYYRLKMYDMRQREEMDEEMEKVEVQTMHPALNNLPPRGAKNAPRTSKETRKDTLLERHVSKGLRRTSLQEEHDELRPAQSRGHWKDAPDFIQSFIDDFSRDLGDASHTTSNITRAYRIFTEAHVEEGVFHQMLYEAKQRAQQATIKKKSETGKPNRMPYFFACLQELAGLKVAL